jgi:hypothetical protein
VGLEKERGVARYFEGGRICEYLLVCVMLVVEGMVVVFCGL